MRAPLLVLPAALLLLVLFVSCDDDPEEVSSQETPTASAKVSSTPSTTEVTATPSLITTHTPAPAPSGWATYTNPELGFSLAYPADLVATEITTMSPRPGETPRPSSEEGLGERDVEFKSPQPFRGFAVSVFLNATERYTLEQFAAEFYCPGDLGEGALGGLLAIRCITEVEDDQPTDVVVANYQGIIYSITSARLTESELTNLLQGFRFLGSQ